LSKIMSPTTADCVEAKSARPDRISAVFAASMIYAVTATVATVMPAFVGIFADHLGLGATQLGIVGAMYSLGLGIVAISSYLWVRQVSWRACVAAGLVLLASSIGLQSLCSRFFQIVPLMFLAGIGAGLAASPSMSALGDGRSPQRNFGIMLMLGVVVPAIVIAAVPGITVLLGYGGVFFLVAALALSCVSLVALLPSFGKRPVQTFGDAERRGSTSASRAMIASLAAMLIFSAGYAAPWNFMERIGIQSGLAQGPLLDSLAAGGLIGGLGGFLAIVMTRLMGLRASFLVAIVATVLSLVSLEIFKVSLVSYLLMNAGFQLWINVNYSNIMSFIAVKDEEGRCVALIPGLAFFGVSAGSVIAGLAFGRAGRMGVVVVAVAAFLICAVLMVIAFQVTRAHATRNR
jgi:predicted MFS family arabinose efflux permease